MFMILFGLRIGEISRIISSIEYAFEVYRNNLSTSIMSSFDKVARRMELSDITSNGKFAAVHNSFLECGSRIPELWEHNEIILRYLVDANNLNLVYSLPLPYIGNHALTKQTPIDIASDNTSNAGYSYDDLNQVMIHLNRDYGEKAQKLRKSLYQNGIIAELLKEIPVDEANRANVLIPGAGLGRLALETAALGYRVEANECSGAMVSAMSTLFHKHILRRNSTVDATDGKEKNSLRYYPYLNYLFTDDWDFETRFQPSEIPYLLDSPALMAFCSDLSDTDIVHNNSTKNIHADADTDADARADSNNGSGTDTETGSDSVQSSADKGSNGTRPFIDYTPLAIQYGDFISTYGSAAMDGVHSVHEKSFDVVITCFFIDTAEDVLQYIAIIQNVLRDGGLWINAGPLHYHSKNAVPYSHSYLLKIIELSGFDHVSSRVIDNLPYGGEDAVSMKPETYCVPLDVFRFSRREEGLFLRSHREGIDVSPSRSGGTDVGSGVGDCIHSNDKSGGKNDSNRTSNSNNNSNSNSHVNNDSNDKSSSYNSDKKEGKWSNRGTDFVLR